MSLTIIANIDNNMDYDLWRECADYLEWSAGDTPIISVSQKPVELGTNIVVGDIGRKVENLWIQALVGAEAATTEFVGIAEQDNFYPKGCFDYRPPKPDTFYYNFNYAMLHYSGPLHGKFGVNSEIRTGYSQLICGRQILIDALTWAIAKMDEGYRTKYENGMIMEPGPWQNLFHQECEIPERFTKYDFWWDEWPSVDMRHNNNFTKQQRLYNMVSDKIIYWGTMDDIMTKRTMEHPCESVNG